MTTLTNWLPTSAMHSLGWTLLHFLWQGTAVAALAAVLMTVSRRASSRYALAVGALMLMLAAPVATFFVLTSSGEGTPAKPSPVAEMQGAVTGNAVRTASGFSRLSPWSDWRRNITRQRQYLPFCRLSFSSWLRNGLTCSTL